MGSRYAGVVWSSCRLNYVTMYKAVDLCKSTASLLSMLMIVGLLVVASVIMIMDYSGIWFMLMGMGGVITLVGMFVIMLEGVGMTVSVVVRVLVLLVTMPVGMFVIMIMFMVMGMLMWMFSLAHDCLLCKK